MAELVYRKVSRFIEYYIILGFVIITVVPLLDFSWVPVFIKIVYFTAFPLLILLLVASMMKDLVLRLLERWFERRQS